MRFRYSAWNTRGIAIAIPPNQTQHKRLAWIVEREKKRAMGKARLFHVTDRAHDVTIIISQTNKIQSLICNTISTLICNIPVQARLSRLHEIIQGPMLEDELNVTLRLVMKLNGSWNLSSLISFATSYWSSNPERT